MLKNKFISFVIFALITYSASFVGAISTIYYKDPWYSSLNKAIINPPDWIFAPVWTIIYLLMTLAIWLAWNKNTQNINLIFIYLIHIFFNTTWSIVFFVMHDIFTALINLIIIILLMNFHPFLTSIVIRYILLNFLIMYHDLS